MRETLKHGMNCPGLIPLGDDCTCGLTWRIKLQTEQEMHAAWRKRAEEAEVSLSAMTARFTAPIVCICGSTRFKQAWIAENARLTGEGNIVLAVGLWGHHERVFPDAETKKRLDELHLRKIDLCDWVWVLDIGGYIGESTRNEIAYAEAHGKPVRYLSKEMPDYVEPVDPILARAESAEGEARRLREAVEWTLSQRVPFYDMAVLRRRSQGAGEG